MMRISVSLLEKTDAQIHYVSGRDVPVTDPCKLNVSDDLRPTADFEVCLINDSEVPFSDV
jgi:hypothetical protein